jgi:hypothetical protein
MPRTKQTTDPLKKLRAFGLSSKKWIGESYRAQAPKRFVKMLPPRRNNVRPPSSEVALLAPLDHRHHEPEAKAGTQKEVFTMSKNAPVTASSLVRFSRAVTHFRRRLGGYDRKLAGECARTWPSATRSLGGTKDMARSARAVMVNDGFTPGFADIAAPSIT